MAKTRTRRLPGTAAPDGKISPIVRPAAVRATEPFPPLTISLDSFLKNGSDRAFRQLIFALTGLRNQMQRHMDQFARYIGTNNPQFQLIMIMAQTSDLTVSEIAGVMNVTSQFVTIEISKLIRRGIVEKQPNPNDRRSSFLNLTSKGRNLVQELAPVLRRANDLHFRSLTENSAKILTDMLNAIVEDGKRVIHELESPDIRNAMAPTARLERDAPKDTARSARKEARRR